MSRSTLRRWPFLAALSLSAAAALVYLSRARRRADDVAVLRVIAGLDPTGCPFSRRRILGALRRLWARGDAVRAPACSWLTRQGWARVGMPLSEDEEKILDEALRRVPPSQSVVPLWKRYDRALAVLYRRGLVDAGAEITDAGRVALRGAP